MGIITPEENSVQHPNVRLLLRVSLMWHHQSLTGNSIYMISICFGKKLVNLRKSEQNKQKVIESLAYDVECILKSFKSLNI